ncbi:MAG TPA: LuxR C-terminal-related transcriptional regulator [Bryobacteraceae bacterium]|jgi:two-component system, NarL family, response regulator NreC|nr:LuxR C-terminal-related transcriptional regulator [Bryobacteraceae bacterium]
MPKVASNQAESSTLTARQRETLILIAEGKTTKEIAVSLGVSFKTAAAHRTNLMNRLRIHDTAHLVRHAIRTGLIEA